MKSESPSRSVKNASVGRATSAGAMSDPSKLNVKRERTSFGELEADEESLKLIRELQEQDFGLRRRGRV